MAVTDLWGNLVDDFQKAYFSGGRTLAASPARPPGGMSTSTSGSTGIPSAMPGPLLTVTPPGSRRSSSWKARKAAAAYFRNAIGPLPPHRVLFTNVLVQYEGFPSATTNQDWFHYMQIWPRYSEPEVCHHVFHQYSFFKSQSKMPFGGDAVGQMLTEGLATYYEQVLPSLFLDDPRYAGKLFEFYVMDKRPRPSGSPAMWLSISATTGRP